MKRWAEINGHLWEAVYPLCAGCPELCVGGACSWEGNGCRFPDMRTKRPASMYVAFHLLCKSLNKSSEQVANEIGGQTEL